MSEIVYPRTPRLAELLGVETALRLVESFGGVLSYVPKRIAEGHKLYPPLGDEGARKLAAEFVGKTLRLPKGSKYLRHLRNEKIRAEHQEGKSGRQLALQYRLTDRQIWRILGESPESDSRQRSLF